MLNSPQILPIVILNWNSFEDTHECLQSIFKTKPQNIKIYLMDNGSAATDVEALKSNYGNHPQIELRLFETNLGFAKAHNILLKELLELNYNYVFLLNNDTVVEESSLKKLQNILDNDPSDMISFKMINYYDRSRMDNAGHRLMTSGEILPKHHGVLTNTVNSSFQNLGPCAGAAVYSMAMLKHIGLFDPFFKTGYEDAELGLRAILASYTSKFHPELMIYHKMGTSIKKVFNYEYSLKIQTNIYYSYLKLIPRQVLLIHLIPFILRFIAICLVDVCSFRFRHFKVMSMALINVLLKDFKAIRDARSAFKGQITLRWDKLLFMQESTLKRDYLNFIKYIIKGEKSYFEKY